MNDGNLTNDLPVWWPYPASCAHGHAWGPGKIIVAFRRCTCVGDEPGAGHTVVNYVASRYPGIEPLADSRPLAAFRDPGGASTYAGCHAETDRGAHHR